MKLLIKFLYLLLFMCVLSSCASGGKWEVIGHHNSPYIKKDRLAIRKERCNITMFHPIAGRCNYDIIFADGTFKKADYAVVGREVAQYILNTGLYDRYKKSDIQYRYYDHNTKQLEHRPKAIPDHKFVIVSVLPTIVLMVPLDNLSDLEPDWGDETSKRYHRSDSVQCDLLIDHAVVTGNKVPYSNDILWFSPTSHELPEKVDFKWFYSGEAQFSLRRFDDTLFIRRER